MKQAILLASLFISFVFASCKKEYTCTCKSSTTVEVKTETIKVKEHEDAKKECASIEKGLNERITAASITCQLK